MPAAGIRRRKGHRAGPPLWLRPGVGQDEAYAMRGPMNGEDRSPHENVAISHVAVVNAAASRLRPCRHGGVTCAGCAPASDTSGQCGPRLAPRHSDARASFSVAFCSASRRRRACSSCTLPSSSATLARRTSSFACVVLRTVQTGFGYADMTAPV